MKIGGFLKDHERHQLEQTNHYLNDIKHTAEQLRPGRKTYSNSHLL